MHVIIFDELPESIRKIQMNFYCFDVSKYLKQDPFGQLKEISEKDFFPNEVCKSMDEISQGIQSVTIVLNENLNWPKAVRLSCHLRFHNYRNQSSAFPIIITFDVQPDLLKDSNTKGVGDIQNFQYEDGFFFKRFDELFEETEDEAGDRKLKFEIFYNEELFGKSFSTGKLEIIQINSKDHGDRHSIANQWGAIKLTLNAGYTKEDIQYEWPPTLYFKYLIKKHESNVLSYDERKSILQEVIIEIKSKQIPESFLQNEKLTLSNHHYFKNKKILLIDDNADKGWIQGLKSIFSMQIVPIFAIKDVFNITDYEDYDLIFFDLYLPNPKKEDKPDMEYSKLMLNALKIKFPHIPIIAFTASNKAWTLDEVTEKGADGMYVKDSPEYAGDEKYSKENFQSFVKTVIKTLDAYLILRPYWEKIEEIKKNFLLQINNDDPSKKFKARIEERLDMFYGLLKRGMYQRKYDEERFFFSDYELAFMTLWSALNEISEAFYEKHQANPSPKVKLPQYILFHPDNRTPITPIYNTESWNIVNQPSDVLFENYWEIDSDEQGNLLTFSQNRYKLINRLISNIKYDKNKTNGKYYDLKESDFKPDKNISIQIAYLIFKMVDLNINSVKKESFLDKLGMLNNARNALYLTHGSDIMLDFYKFTESEKRGDHKKQLAPQHNIKPNGDIKDLFELVGFLLTGKEIEVKF